MDSGDACVIWIFDYFVLSSKIYKHLGLISAD